MRIRNAANPVKRMLRAIDDGDPKRIPRLQVSELVPSHLLMKVIDHAIVTNDEDMFMAVVDQVFYSTPVNNVLDPLHVVQFVIQSDKYSKELRNAVFLYFENSVDLDELLLRALQSECSEELITRCLEAGANVSDKVLSRAICGNLDIQQLENLEKHSELTWQTHHLFTMIKYADHEDMKLLEWLISQKEVCTNGFHRVPSNTSRQYSPLGYAWCHGRLRTVQYLLLHTDVGDVNTGGLHLCDKQWQEMPLLGLMWPSFTDKTCLEHAEAVRTVLRQANVNIDKQQSFDRRTSLLMMLANKRNHCVSAHTYDAIFELLEARPDLYTEDLYQQNALSLSLTRGCIPVFQTLLRMGVRGKLEVGDCFEEDAFKTHCLISSVQPIASALYEKELDTSFGGPLDLIRLVLSYIEIKTFQDAKDFVEDYFVYV